MSNIKTHKGSCHCGLITFEVDIDASAGTMCNCRICTKLGGRQAIVKPDALRITSDASKHGNYGNAIGGRTFCTTCGVHTFGHGDLPELGGAFVSVNLNSLDDIEQNDITLMHWDGRHDNWQSGPRPTPWPRSQA
jgi:hypothetical protein